MPCENGTEQRVVSERQRRRASPRRRRL